MDYSTINNLKLESYQQIINVLSQNLDIAKISEFKTGLDQLYINQKKLVDLHSLLGKDNDSVEKTREDSRTDLTQKTLPVLTIMQIFAYDKKKKKLSKRVENLSLEYLQYCSDFQLINTSRKIWEIANKYGGYSLAYRGKIKSGIPADKLKAMAKLENQYGLIPVMIKNIEEANLRFIESLLHFDAEMKEKDKILMKIKKLYKQTENLLVNKIDRFVSLVESENPDFFKEYQKARTDLLQYEMKEKTDQDELLLPPINEDKLARETKVKTGERKTKSKAARRARPVEA